MSAPDKIGPYPIVRKLGEGGMGVVYEVRDPQLGRPLALKLIRATDASRTALDRFWREAEALGKVAHPCIVRIHSTGRTPQGPYLVQELLDGEPLDALIERGLPGPRRTAELVRDLADALATVHAAGLLHRDLKPANVIVREDGRPVLIDFGLAWDAQAETITRAGAAMGTPAYMPPEQARGLKSSQLDPRCDVYGVGTILYELLTGRPPFQGDTALELFAKVLSSEPDWPAQVRPGVLADLDAICRRAMAREREDRYPSAGALRDDLSRFLRGEPIEVAPAASSVSSLLRGVRRGVRRRWALLVGGAVAGVALAAPLWLRAERRAQADAQAVATALAELDSLGASLGHDASERTLEQAERALAGPEELRARSEPEAAERLAAAIAVVRARRERARLLRAAAVLERSPAAPDAAAIDSALELAARVPPGADPEVEEARGLALLLAGLAPGARDALARAATDAPPPAPAPPLAAGGAHDLAAAWLEAPAARRAWRLAWAALAAGDPAAGEARLAGAPALLRARLAAAAAALAPAGEASAARERALALLEVRDRARPARDPAVELVVVALEVDALRRRPDAPEAERHELLLRARALSLPASPAKVAPALQAEACLLEGDLLLGLGWPASAAEAFARRARLTPGAGPGGAPAPPSLLAPVRGGDAIALAAPDLAALAGEARARSLDLDAAADAEALAAARLRARHHPALAQDPLRLEPGLELALDLGAEGHAELACARAAPDARARAAHLEAARRALRLAVRGAPRDPGAWSGLVAAEALAGDLTAARAALAEASARAPGARATREGELFLELAAGRPDAARAALTAVLAAIDAAAPRALERAQRADALLRDVHAALVAAGCDVDAVAVLELRATRADAERLPPAARRALHAAMREAAARIGRPDLALRAAKLLAGVEAQEAQLQETRRSILAQRQDALARDAVAVRGREELARVLAASPAEAQVYISGHNLGGRFLPGGFDNLVLAFELDAPAAIVYMNSFDPRNVAPQAREAALHAISLFAGPGERDPTLPLPRDDALRASVGALYGLEVRVALSSTTLRACHEQARDFMRRRPDLLASSMLIGRLRVGVGDHAGALRALARAEVLRPPFDPESRSDPIAWSLLHRALAHGALRRWEECQAHLVRLVDLGARKREGVLGHRIEDEPLFREDRALSGTLPPWALDLARRLPRTR